MNEIITPQTKPAETTDVKPTPNKPEKTVEEAIQEKFQETDAQKVFLNIFKTSAISGTFSQEEIVDYIKNKSLLVYAKTLKSKTQEQQLAFVLERMDNYYKEETGILKEVQVAKDLITNEDKENKEMTNDNIQEANEAQEEKNEIANKVDEDKNIIK